MPWPPSNFWWLTTPITGPNVGGAPGFRDRFMLALRDNGERGSFGYPVHLRRVALADGKLNGQLPSSSVGTPCGSMLELNIYTRFRGGLLNTIIGFFGFGLKTTSPVTIATSYASFLPDANTTGCSVFFGTTSQTAGLTWGRSGPTATQRVRVNGGSQGSWDLAPGGTRPTQQQLHDQFEAAGQGQEYQVSVTDVHPNHCFIPTVSALGFQYQSMASYQNTSSLPNPYTNLLTRGDLVCNNEIPFDDFYAPATGNLAHVTTDAGAVAFLIRELTPRVATPVFTAAPTAMCPGSQATFSVANCASRTSQPATGYVWTVGNGLQIVSGQGTSTVTVQAVVGYTGTTTLQVAATRIGYAASVPILVLVRVGNGYLQINGPTGPECFYTDLTYTLTSSLAEAGAGTEWHVALNNVLHDEYIVRDFGTSLLVRPTATGNLEIRVTGLDACSPYQPLTATFNTAVSNVMPDPNGGVPRSCIQPRGTKAKPAAYPNPADAVLTLTEPEAALAPGPRTAVLYNAQGREVQRTRKGEALLPTAGVPSGLYYLMVEAAGHVTRSQIRVQH